MSEDIPSSAQKALSVNLDPKIYGTFAEIGAGQEVVRHFFQVGGAAGTVAKSMSAYDMSFSDAIYGKEESGRYVCQHRVEKMLEKEFALLEKRLVGTHREEHTYFVFADTVAARSYKKKEMECHGWLGVRFQASPRSPASDIHVHVRMLDQENLRQQEALGILGVNLIYGAFFYSKEPEKIIDSLLDNVAPGRLEVDFVYFGGELYKHIDNRLMALQLVTKSFTEAALFSPEGKVLVPSETLYKRPVLIQRGSFRPPTLITMDMHNCGHQQFVQEKDVAEDQDKIVLVKEITMHSLLSSGAIDHKDFLARVDILAALGNNVMISNCYEYYRLTSYLSRYTKKKIGVVLGIRELQQLFDEQHYNYLEGGLLEAFGRMLRAAVKIYVYPWKEDKNQKLITADNFQPAEHLKPLYTYLKESGRLEGLKHYNDKTLHIITRHVLEKIQAQDASWEKLVPDQVTRVIKQKGLFGFEEPRRTKKPAGSTEVA